MDEMMGGGMGGGGYSGSSAATAGGNDTVGNSISGANFGVNGGGSTGFNSPLVIALALVAGYLLIKKA